MIIILYLSVSYPLLILLRTLNYLFSVSSSVFQQVPATGYLENKGCDRGMKVEILVQKLNIIINITDRPTN